MAHTEPNWQPITMLPTIEGMVAEALTSTAEQHTTLAQARTKPHVLDDATVNRARRLMLEQADFVDIYAEQARRWSELELDEDQAERVTALAGQVEQLHTATRAILQLIDELAHGTIDQVLSMSDLELGLQTLLGKIRP